MTDEETTMLTARIPAWLVAELTRMAENSGMSRTQVILDALAAYITPLSVDGSDPKVQPGNRQGEM